MPDDIPLIPPIPEVLREARQLGKLVPFVGAGASKLAGCPDWDGFAQGVISFLVGEGKFSYAQAAQIEGLNPRIKLSLAISLAKELGVSIGFKSILHRQPRRGHAMGCRVYSEISKLSNTFVTTNYDEWLDDDLGAPSPSIEEGDTPSVAPIGTARKVYYKPADLSAFNLNSPGSVLHLHGSLKEPEGMVITTQDYVAHYANDRWAGGARAENPVLTFLEDLFRNKSVLFIGYGLAELEILEYVVLKSRAAKNSGQEPRHYLLQGFFSHERELMLGMNRYYRECGIGLLPFLKDEKGWEQLADVLTEFAREIPASALSVLQELTEMDGLLNG